jgi:hypothetical protein
MQRVGTPFDRMVNETRLQGQTEAVSATSAVRRMGVFIQHSLFLLPRGTHRQKFDSACINQHLRG